MSKIGLIAGRGMLPSIWAKAAKAKGNRVYAVQIIEEADSSLEDIADQVKPINVGNLDQIINFFKSRQINDVVMIGKADKSLLFQKGLIVDRRMKRILAELPQLNDDDIMLAIVRELAGEGIVIIKQSRYIEELFPEAGILTSIKPDEQLLSDMKYGFKMAREIGRLDIGQTVIVKNRAVLAVEAIEGTDNTIKRGGKLGGKGVVMAKVSKPSQDFRFDIPTVGRTTLDNLINIDAGGLVIEAGKTFLLDKESFIQQAEKNGIVVMAVG